ncbi:MAG: hypothetical protein FK733_19390 [Asgard group archaeon]|nr:hypothetical protein [Asgard group archaeon]
MSYQNSNRKLRVSIILLIATAIMIILSFITSRVLSLGFGGDFMLFELVFLGCLIMLFLLVFVRFISPPRPAVKPKFITALLDMLEIQHFNSLDPKSICVVCLSDFTMDEKIVACPNCNCYFHRAHLLVKLETRFSCPICEFDYNNMVNNDMIEN